MTRGNRERGLWRPTPLLKLSVSGKSKMKVHESPGAVKMQIGIRDFFKRWHCENKQGYLDAVNTNKFEYTLLIYRYHQQSHYKAG